MPRPALFARAAAVAALLLAGGGAPAAASEDEASSPHVHAVGDVGGPLLRELTDLGEAGWTHWKQYFAAEPPAARMPLRMDVRKDRDGFVDAVRRAGVHGSLPDAGGYYDPATRVSFLYLQTHVSSTRLLVLHELTHQFQYKALQDDRPDKSPIWHREGLAEHFGAHRRVPGGVEVGALDVVSIDDRPVQCAKRVADPAFSAWEIGAGAKSNPDYTDSMVLVETFLRTKDTVLRKQYGQWEAEVYRGGNAGKRFERVFAGMKDRIDAAVHEVWDGFRRTWTIGYVAWDEKDGVIEGRGMPWAFLVGGAEVAPAHLSIEAEIALPVEAPAAGIALAVRGPEDFVGVEVRHPAHLCLRARKNQVWSDFASAELASPLVSAPVRLRLSFSGTEAVVAVAGVPVLRYDLSKARRGVGDLLGAAGLFAEGGTVRFAKVHTGE